MVKIYKFKLLQIGEGCKLKYCILKIYIENKKESRNS